MSLFVSESSTSNIPLLAEDSYPAICTMLVDLGDQYSEKFDKTTRKVVISWELPGEKLENGDTRRMSNTYTASINDKSKLRKDLISWRGRDFTPDELKKFDLKNIVGAPCLLQIIHKVGQDGTKRAVIGGIMKLPKGMAVPEATLAPIIFDMDDPAVFDKFDVLPEWIKTRIMESETWKNLEAEKQYAEAERSGRAGEVTEAEKEKFIEELEDDTDLPFDKE